MSGTPQGGHKAKLSNMARDPDHYKRIGSKGGSKKGVKKGFALMTYKQRAAHGSRGGKLSKRLPSSYYKKETSDA